MTTALCSRAHIAHLPNAHRKTILMRIAALFNLYTSVVEGRLAQAYDAPRHEVPARRSTPRGACLTPVETPVEIRLVRDGVLWT